MKQNIYDFITTHYNYSLSKFKYVIFNYLINIYEVRINKLVPQPEKEKQSRCRSRYRSRSRSRFRSEFLFRSRTSTITKYEFGVSGRQR